MLPRESLVHFRIDGTEVSGEVKGVTAFVLASR